MNVTFEIVDEDPSSELMEVQLPMVGHSACSQAYRSYHNVKIDQSVLCAGPESGGKDACRVNIYEVQSIIIISILCVDSE